MRRLSLVWVALYIDCKKKKGNYMRLDHVMPTSDNQRLGGADEDDVFCYSVNKKEFVFKL